jgi:hypothetical protein
MSNRSLKRSMVIWSDLGLGLLIIARECA